MHDVRADDVSAFQLSLCFDFSHRTHANSNFANFLVSFLCFNRVLLSLRISDMAGNKGKKGGRHTPRKNAKNERKARRVSQERKTVPDNENEETSQEEIVNIPLDSEMADGNREENTARAVLRDGEALLDMEVRESEDEFLNEEIIERQGRNGSRSRNKDQTRMIDANNWPDDNSEVQFKMINNNATTSRNVSVAAEETRSTEMSEMVRNEKFMEDFAQYMVKNGLLVKNDNAGASFGAVAAGQKRKMRGNDTKDLGAPRSQVVKGCQPEVPRRVHGNDKQQRGQGKFDLGQMEIGGSPSELTIYKRAVPMCTDEHDNVKRISNSSEEMVDISDESAEGFDNTNVVVQNISDRRWIEDRRETTRPSAGRYIEDGQVAHSSRQEPPPLMRPRPQIPTSEQDQLVRDAERSKARILEVPGKFHEVDHNPDNFKNDFLNRMSGEFAHSMLVDEEFSMVASHVDEATRRKIANTEYVDFVRLLPRDEIAVDQESGRLSIL